MDLGRKQNMSKARGNEAVKKNPQQYRTYAGRKSI